MSQIVHRTTEVVHRYVLELRYLLGHLYWDRCGKPINEIVSRDEGWDFDRIDGGTCHLCERERNLYFNVSALKLDLSQVQSAEVATLVTAPEFGSIADSLSVTVTEILQLSEFSRIGFRAWYLYPTTDRDDSYNRVRKLKVLSPEIENLMLGRVSEAACRFVIERPGHMVRAAVTPCEPAVNLSPGIVRAARTKARDQPHHQRQLLLDKAKAEKIIQSYPQFGVLVDLDAYIEDPPYPNALSMSGFVEDARSSFEAIKSVLLEERTP